MNIPETFIKVSSLTNKDIKDLELCLNLSLDYVALSFVQKAKDLIELKKYTGEQTGIMAKFEKRHTKYRKSICIMITWHLEYSFFLY